MDLADDDLLPEEEYCFFVPSPGGTDSKPAHKSPTLSCLLAARFKVSRRMNILPNFRSWSFPDQVPPSFRLAVTGPTSIPSTPASGASSAPQHDAPCRLTAHDDPVERAHVIPRSERAWFNNNGMATFDTNPSGRGNIDSMSNIIMLHKAVHALWDRMKFSIVPKRNLDDEWALAVHVHIYLSESAHQTYHNRSSFPLREVSPEYVFARFAWDVFPLLPVFLQPGARLLVLQVGPEKPVERQYTDNECKSFCEGQGEGRSSVSSNKRQRTPTEISGPRDLADSFWAHSSWSEHWHFVQHHLLPRLLWAGAKISRKNVEIGMERTLALGEVHEVGGRR